MRTVLVASSKGGAGKSTLATNLAAYFALGGKHTVLIDADRQKSSTHWAEKRAGLASAVLPVDGTRRGWEKLLPGDTQRAVIDAAAGAMGDDGADAEVFGDTVRLLGQASLDALDRMGA